eukprot:2787717-Prymnesium_polylepis.1
MGEHAGRLDDDAITHGWKRVPSSKFGPRPRAGACCAALGPPPQRLPHTPGAFSSATWLLLAVCMADLDGSE